MHVYIHIAHHDAYERMCEIQTVVQIQNWFVYKLSIIIIRESGITGQINEAASPFTLMILVSCRNIYN